MRGPSIPVSVGYIVLLVSTYAVSGDTDDLPQNLAIENMQLLKGRNITLHKHFVCSQKTMGRVIHIYSQAVAFLS